MAIKKFETNQELGETGKRSIVLDNDRPNSLMVYFTKKEDIQIKKKNTKNILLYEKGIYNLFDKTNEISVLRSSEEGGYIAISPTREDDRYSLWVNNRSGAVITSPSNAVLVLEGIREAFEKEEYKKLKEVYKTEKKSEVKRDITNKFSVLFDGIEICDWGWIIENSFIVTWNGLIYGLRGDSNPDDIILKGNRIEMDSDSLSNFELELTEKLESFNFVKNDMSFNFGEKEITFLSKVAWLKQRNSQVFDPTFWETYAVETDF